MRSKFFYYVVITSFMAFALGVIAATAMADELDEEGVHIDRYIEGEDGDRKLIYQGFEKGKVSVDLEQSKRPLKIFEEQPLTNSFIVEYRSSNKQDLLAIQKKN